MAETEEAQERMATIPLRKSWVKKPRDDRTKRAIMAIKEYVSRHTGADDVRVSESVNEAIWKRGRQKPQGKIRVKLSVSKGVAKVMLPGEKESHEAEKKGAASSLKEKITGKKAEAKSEGSAKEAGAATGEEAAKAETAAAQK